MTATSTPSTIAPIRVGSPEPVLSLPRPTHSALATPVCSLEMSRVWYMKRQMIDAPTSDSAIGMKMIDLAIFSPPRPSASTAIASPRAVEKNVTVTTHHRLLMIVPRMAVKAPKHTNMNPTTSGSTVGLPSSTARPVSCFCRNPMAPAITRTRHADQERDAGEHVRPLRHVPARLVGERLRVVLEAHELLGIPVEQGEVGGADRRDHEHDGDEQQPGPEEDPRPGTTMPDRGARCSRGCGSHRRIRRSSSGRDHCTEDRRPDVAVAEVRAAPVARAASRARHRAAVHCAVHACSRPADPGPDGRDDDGVHDRRDPVDAWLVLLTDQQPDAGPDQGEPADRGRSCRRAGSSLAASTYPDGAERDATDERTEHPRAATRCRSRSSAGCRGAGSPTIAPRTANPIVLNRCQRPLDLVEQDVGADPDAGADRRRR